MHPPVPVLVLAGFLGVGKTTLLNHLLHNDRGVRIGVLVNDFGAINVDALTVAGQVDASVSLGNGCLCCAVDASGLDRMLDRLTRAGGLDLIVIEASGLAEPRELVRLVLSAEHEGIEYGGLVEVVDAAEFEATRARHPELDRHLAFADLVVLNKIDRVGAEDVARVRELAGKLSGGRPVLPVSHGGIDVTLLLDPVARPRPPVEQLSFDELLEHGDHLHAEYQTVAFETAAVLHPRKFLRFLDERPAGLYRAKGTVDFGERFTLHTVGRFLRFERAERAAGGTSLVLIGTGLDEEALRAALNSCVEPDPDSIEPNAMLRVWRYTS
ncbi:GTP-binding protein [Amycolatopsis acidiphila]|uniref:GTP-binding protein n=1 Tax=Amycolatopsis acidiphila TaxID=715473 RepID=A0A558AAD8_9PSEU|nr:CobW family GTP-binding protein [Amycolatopsis acidiphila]TVT21219.1 GTP-binding protein [Amycolatopsis acidiphila]UIJ61236.1 GTP-binding protein [Amycolatopsis acidiphila]GHG78651.1 cobalamin biosynthesis protein CobW [Amycolatopsis acidiphila]